MPCKAEQPLRDMKLQEKEAQQRLKHTGNLFRKKMTVKRCLLILDLQPLRSYVKGNHSVDRDFQSLVV